MKSDGGPLDIFFQKLPMSTVLFDRQLIMLRCNPTWINYIEDITQVIVESGTHFYDLLPGIESAIQPYIDRTLAGAMTTADNLRLNCSDNVFYWDASFVPWNADDKTTGFLLVVADVTERVLSRQILERKVVDRTQKLSALYDVMTVAAEPLDLKDKLDQSLQLVVTAVHAQAGTIQLLDSVGETLFLVAHQGLSPNLADKLRTMSADVGLSGWITKERQPLALADITTNPQAPDLVRKSDFRAFVGVPMTARGKTIGILSVYRQAKRPYSREDIALLDSVADQIGTAVENTRLHLENERLLIVKERNRLARELHDAVTQSLYSLTLHAETSMRFVKSGQPDLASEYIEKVAETSQQALREMRLLLHNLRPAVLEHLGLVKAIRQRLDAVEKRVGVVVDYQVKGQIDLPAHVEEALYHIVQEALNNTLKHAAATQISLRLHQHEASVALTVSDNGKGFRLLELSDNGGLGLTSMRERVDSLGGDLNIDTRVGGGSRIQVELDLGHVKEFVDSHDVIDLL